MNWKNVLSFSKKIEHSKMPDLTTNNTTNVDEKEEAVKIEESITVIENPNYISITTSQNTAILIPVSVVNSYDIIRCNYGYVVLQNSNSKHELSFKCDSNNIAIKVYDAVVKYKYKEF